MKIAILSRESRNYSTARLREAAVKRGHKVKVLDTLKFGMFVEPGHPNLTYRGRQLSHYDAIIPRIGASITFYGTAVVRQFEQMGVFSLNPSHAISVSRDKLRSMQVLSRHDVGIASSGFVKQKDDVLPAIKRMGGSPVIVKLLEGTQGVGVILADSEKVAQAIIETLQSTRQNVLVQKFVKESRGRDIRAFVIGDRVVAAMRRVAQGTEFRSNVHRGGKTENVTLDNTYTRTAVRAAQILGLRVAGVDMLEGKDGPVIMEVNSSPGLEGIENTTGMDIANEIVAYMEEQLSFDESTLHVRLGMAKGYTVAEFAVLPTSELANKPLQDSGLRERDIIVMSINRNDQHIPLPTKTEVLLPGDVLTCYGKKITLQNFIPTLSQRKGKGKRKGKAKAKAKAVKDGGTGS